MCNSTYRRSPGYHLKTFAFDNLYVSDASTFPLPLVRPPTLTIIGQSKRLAKHLIGTRLRDTQIRKEENVALA